MKQYFSDKAGLMKQLVVN